MPCEWYYLLDGGIHSFLLRFAIDNKYNTLSYMDNRYNMRVWLAFPGFNDCGSDTLGTADSFDCICV